MPCWTVQNMSVEFKAENRALLDKAIAALGWPIRVNSPTRIIFGSGIELDLARGKAEITSNLQPQLNELKRAYSYQAVKLAAAAKGWVLQGNSVKGQMVKY